MTQLKDDPSIQFNNWNNWANFTTKTFVCGFCGDKVASGMGYLSHDARTGQPFAFIRICPGCLAPTFFSRLGKQYPGEKPGKEVKGLPDDVSALYTEARLSAGTGAHTAAVLACRKVLMHIAVAEGAGAGLSFVEYIQYLDQKGYVPPKGKAWVDYIRTRGNEANHEIVLMKEDDAVSLISFTEMLLKFIYEFPGMVPKPGIP